MKISEIVAALENDNAWLFDSQVKYVQITVDTRSGGLFSLRDRDGNTIEPERLLKAHEKALECFGPEAGQ